jgi:hypothetical protein
MTRFLRVLFGFLFSLIAAGAFAQQPQVVQLAGLRPSQELALRRVSPTAEKPDGPVLYQLVFTPGTPGTIARFDTNPRHLVNSDITDNGSTVVIGNSGFMINVGSGMVNFVNGQAFPGTVTSLSNGDSFLTITSLTTTPVINLNIANTDARYVLKAGDTMTGTLNLPANGLVAGGTQLALSGGKVGVGTNGPNTQLQVVGAGGGSRLYGIGITGAVGDAALNVVAGAGEQITNGLNSTGGTGGSPSITAGAGGSINTGNNASGGTGGSVTIAAGAGGTVATGVNISDGGGGNVFVRPGSGNPSGNVLIADAGGNVGIGTTTPGQKLEVAGNIAVSGRISLGITVTTLTPNSAPYDAVCTDTNDAAIGGGAYGVANQSVLRESRPNGSNTWRVSCTDVNSHADVACAQAYVVCLGHAQ